MAAGTAAAAIVSAVPELAPACIAAALVLANSTIGCGVVPADAAFIHTDAAAMAAASPTADVEPAAGAAFCTLAITCETPGTKDMSAAFAMAAAVGSSAPADEAAEEAASCRFVVKVMSVEVTDVPTWLTIC